VATSWGNFSICSARLKREGNCPDKEAVARGEAAEADNTVGRVSCAQDSQADGSALELQSFNQVAAFKQIPRSQRLSHRRISVVGTIGSGKTTFAHNASKLLDVPHIELDALHWEPNWIEAPNDLFRQRVEHSLQGDLWVVDGNYHQVRDIVWSRADTVVWLDYPFKTIMGRLAKRTLRRLITHEKLWNGNQEHVRGLLTRDSVFLWAIRTYRRRRRQYPILLGRPENSHLTVVRLRSPRDAADFLSMLGRPGDLTN
jgi:adenylate kinase family enzyme